MLDTAGDPVEAKGIGTVKLTLRGKFNQPLVLKNVYFTPRVGMNLISVPKLVEIATRWWCTRRTSLCNAADGLWGPPTTRRRIY
jgi:hypothetical protein